MGVFEHGAYRDHEEVSFFHDEASGLRAIVAIHRLVQGRAGGGIRIRDYPDETEALRDVLRLSR
ncbi:MAG TPA: amino acid dehydrogenase, partial [Planctomycetaceae bacterium]|nr:amino acid dehydrogenase [Planctomycetaceae bacterium]